MKYSWCTVALPEYTPKEIVHKLNHHGYQGVEWRVIDDTGDTSKPGYWKGNRSTLQESWSLAQFKEAAQMTRDGGLEVPGLQTYVRCHEFGKIEKMMEVARLFGAPFIRAGVSDYPADRPYGELFAAGQKNLVRVEELARQYQVKVVVEMHMNSINPSASAMVRLLQPFSPLYVGAIYDVGNLVQEGFENYQMGLEILGPYLSHVHLKNMVLEPKAERGPIHREWEGRFTSLRDGSANLTAFYRALREVGYQGWISLEDLSGGMTAEEKMKENMKVVEELEKEVEELNSCREGKEGINENYGIQR
jgi:sugar phosphate isomerase/epimerase